MLTTFLFRDFSFFSEVGYFLLKGRTAFGVVKFDVVDVDDDDDDDDVETVVLVLVVVVEADCIFSMVLAFVVGNISFPLSLGDEDLIMLMIFSSSP